MKIASQSTRSTTRTTGDSANGSLRVFEGASAIVTGGVRHRAGTRQATRPAGVINGVHAAYQLMLKEGYEQIYKPERLN